MDTLQFLRTVWPETGLYALAIPFTPPGATKPVYRHRVFETVQEAAAEAARLSGMVDVYFAVHTLRERQVWNPLKKNFKDGTLGAFEVRSHANMAAARSYFFDLDVDPNSAGKYVSAADAAAALRVFCVSASLPLPLVVGSGRGLHCYWPLDTAMDSVTWRQGAERLRALASKLGLRFDPARTTDVSSVLRVPGTMHLKDRSNPLPVRVERARHAIATPQFMQALREACITNGVAETSVLKRPLHSDDPLPDIGSNVEKIHADRPPPTMQSVLSACAQINHLYTHQDNVSEPEWFQALNTIKFVDDPVTWAHAISRGHKGYSRAETDDKFGRIQASTTGPTSCAVLAATCGASRCEACRFSGRVKNPIMAARMMDAAPAPEVTTVTALAGASDDDEPLLTTAVLPNPPKPYRRVRGGGIVMDVTDKEGDELTVTVYEHDLHPIRRVVNSAEQLEQQHWRVTLPREPGKDFVLDSDALYDSRKLMSVLANNGVYPNPNQIPSLRDYMIAYIAELQKAVDAEPQCGHLGWSDDRSYFVLPHGAIQKDGTLRPVSLTKQGERVSVHITKAGTLAAQVAALHFYDDPAYAPQQFFILGGLAAPLFHMTGHHGVISHMQGLPGASKSSSLYTAASFWGHPKMYPINGTNSGATMKGRNERISTLANLPVCVDEVTHLNDREAMDLAMNVTQPGHRIRLDVTGTERAAAGGHKSTIMMTTANSSLHSKLSAENSGGTAGSMRVFELLVHPQSVHQKWEADAYLLTLEENYGHVGEVFISYVIKNYDLVHQRVREAMKFVDEQANIQPAERFWSALIAATVVAAGISRKLGLTAWQPQALMQWVLTQQIPSMRAVVGEEYTDPINTLTNYLTEIHSATIVVDSRKTEGTQMFGAGRGSVHVIRQPRGSALLAQIDVANSAVWVAHKHFKDYCRRTGANWRELIEHLQREGKDGRRVIVAKTRKVLGAYTEYAGAGVEAWVINGEHVAIASSIRDAVQPTGNVVALKKNAGTV